MEDNKIKNAVLYFRFTKWTRENCSVSNTYDSSMKWCERQNVKVIEIFEDKCKSDATRHPELKKMLACVEKRCLMSEEMRIHYVVVPNFCAFYFDYEKVISLINKLRELGVIIITTNQYYNPDLPEDLKRLKQYLDNRKITARIYGE